MKTILTDCRHGKFLLLRGDMISQFVQMYGEWCESEVELYQTLLTTDSNVIEVGCNIGLHTVPLAQKVTQGQVFAFEPQRIIYNLACTNISLNNITNAYLYHAGVGDNSGECIIETCDYDQNWNYGAFSLDHGFSHEEAFPLNIWHEKCRIVALDQVIDQPIQLIKIDAEGYEMQVLDGCQRIIAESSPFIFIENNQQQSGDALIAKITALGYRCFWFISPRYRHDNYFQHYVAKNQGVDINMLCVPKNQSISLRWPLTAATSMQSLQDATICY